LLLSPRQRLTMSLALNELATNAAKYGALGSPAGRVLLSWNKVTSENGEERFEFVWRETGGPKVAPSKRTGFGTRIVRDQLPAEFGGSALLEFAADGLVYRLNAPWPKPSE